MKLLVKILLGLVVGALVLLLAIGAFFRFFFDPNDIRANIESAVAKQTGRSLAIEGDLELQYFPWVGMSIGRTRLGEDPAFGDGDFVVFDSASARVKVLPLLSKRIEVDRLSLAGLNVNLIRDAQGRDNWASLIQVDGDTAAPEQTDGASSSFTTQKIGGLDISNAQVVVDDRQAGTRIALSNVNASTGAIGGGDTAVQLSAEFDVEVNEPQLSAHVLLSGDARKDGDTIRVADPRLTVSGDKQVLSDDIRFDAFTLTVEAPSMAASETAVDVPTPRVTLSARGGDALRVVDATLGAKSIAMDIAKDTVRLPGIELEMQAQGSMLPADVDMSLTAAWMDVSPGGETMTLKDYALSVLGVDAAGTLTAGNWSSKLSASGPIAVEQFSLRDLMQRMDIPVDTADSKAMSRVSFNGTLRATDTSAAIDGLTMTLDDTKITGRAGVTDLETSALDFDLTLDRINADGYLAPTAAPAEGQAGSAADSVVLPVDTLRTFVAKGALKIGALTFSDIESTNVQVGINSSGGQMQIYPSKATLYGGTYSGNIKIDARGEEPILSINETVEGIDFKAFASTVMPDVPMSGRFTGNVKMTSRGATTDALKGMLNGRTSFEFADGYIEGIDLWHSVQSIVALADKQVPVKPPSPARTNFEELKGSAQVANGVLAIESMIAAMPHLDVTGDGRVDLNDSSVDVKVQARIVEEKDVELLPREKALVGFRVPVYVGGTIEAPSIDATKSVAGVIAQLAKRRLAGKFGLLGGSDDGTSQNDVDAAVDDKKEELKDKVDEKAKDLLRGLFGGKDKDEEPETTP